MESRWGPREGRWWASCGAWYWWFGVAFWELSREAAASRSALVRLEVWFCGECEPKRGAVAMSMGSAACAMSCKTLCVGGGLSGNRGKLQSPASSNKTSESGSGHREALSSWGLRCQASERPLWCLNWGDAAAGSVGVVMGVVRGVRRRVRGLFGGGRRVRDDVAYIPLAENHGRFVEEEME